ncbi:hypothetical protein [Lapillicoccus sp.]|uniref:hypothetical protein n=1 Tax=Lapillicoccus sp. TaxID=1909287 RepID=UPI0025F93CE0|nr:hypothetical protein [Lapillicoccus sp.]
MSITETPRHQQTEQTEQTEQGEDDMAQSATAMPGAPDAPDARSGLRRVAAISASLVGTYALTSVLGLAFWLLAARQFSVGAVGVGGAAISLMTLLGTLGTCGLGTLLIARFPVTEQGRRRALTRTALVVAGGVATVLAVAVPFVAIEVLHVGNLDLIAGGPTNALIFAIGTGLMAVALVVDQAVLVLGSGSLQLERNAIASGVKLAALAGLALAGQSGGMTIFLAWGIGTLLSFPLVAVRTRGGRALQDPGTRLIDFRTMRGLGGQALSHHALNTTLQAPLQILPLLVLVLVSSEQNGVFTTALQVTGVVFALPYSISVALFASAEGATDSLLERMRFTIPLSFGVSLLANLLLFPLAPYVLSVFGSQYSTQGVEILRILAFAGLPFVVKDHFVALRRVQGRTTEATGVMVGATVIELAAAYAGVRLDGAVGLCLAWVGVLVVEALILAVPLWRMTRTARPGDASASATLEAAPLPVEAAVVPVDVAALLVRAPTTYPAETPARRIGTTEEDGVEQETLSPAALPDAAPDIASDEKDDHDGPFGMTDDRDGDGTDLPPTSQSAVMGLIRNVARVVGAGPVVLLMTGGLISMAAAVSLARTDGGSTTAQSLYVLGLVVIFLPAAIGVLLPKARASTRILLAVSMAVLLQLSRLVLYPTRFMFHDELIHANVLRLMGETGHLFTENSLLPVTAYYPGLEIATNAIHDLTGLSAYASGVVILLASRVVIALAVLLVVSHITLSPRIGATAVIIYSCNPQMLFFNSQFSYQTIALPLAVFAVYLVVSRRQGSRTSLVAGMLATVAVTFSHHVTAALLIAAYLVWWVLELVLHRRTRNASLSLGAMVVVAAGSFAVSLANPGNTLLSYLGSIGQSSVDAVVAVLSGKQTRKVFQNSAGVVTAPWEKYAIIASLVLTLAVLLPAVIRSRRFLKRRVASVLLLLLVAILYPLIPGGHLTVSTAEVGDRSAGFVFLGVAFVVAWWVWQHRMTWWKTTVLAAGATVIFIGSVVLGAGSITQQLPGPFRVSDDARSIDADNLAAAGWMAAHLPPESITYADRVGGLLAAADGGQYSVTHIGTGVDASRLLLDPDFGAKDVEVIKAAHIRYLIADRRDAFGLPNQGVYIESGEFGGDNRTTPVPAAALRKFSTVPGVDVLYDNGSIVIYDLGALDAS